MPGYGPAGEVGEFTVLKSQPRADEALTLLKTIHSRVKPIMRKHGWHLPVLSEFFPKKEGLLGININRGSKICLRLRPANDPSSFLPLDEEQQFSLVGTMLHELTHNVRGPHDEIFFKQLDALWDEYEALQKSGYSGEGFLGKGNRVGEGVSHDKGITVREAREKALRKFEERERVRKVLGTGGKLGGAAPDVKGKRRGDILAEAAERRMNTKKTCGGDDAHDHPSGSKKEDLPRDVQDDIDRAERDSRSFVIDLTLDDSDEDDVDADEPADRPASNAASSNRPQAGKREKRTSSSPELQVLPPAKRAITASATASSSRAPAPTSRSAQAPAPALSTPATSASASPPTTTAAAAGWICSLCTYQNYSPLALACEIRNVQDGWACHACSMVNEHLFWSCGTCGTVKRSSAVG
ncbi:hypothetical protein Rhopal_002658-T1 [Rhodotorula paludigena]|uniref:WLM domain-containing protein n=1 Tax=Rhodotorula paludigena TaxID=86838 RepID=A0AAV5GAP8_9BASI|nr:hypothetical protein Rhopal_002658-T1 [Rhodotorula paludigena]